MKTLTLDTDLHCNHCVEQIKGAFDNDQSIAEWSVDLNPEIKTITVSGQSVSKHHVKQLLNESGYDLLQATSKTSFWSDKSVWKRASFNTLNCLIGCSIGDFGMVFYLQAYHPQTPLAWQMVLAIIAGLVTSILLETVLLKTKEGFNWALALKTAFGMSFISMVAMELAMTSTDFMITGGKAAFDDPFYWLALVPALLAGYVTPLPYNYYKLKKFNKACH